jgi:hypothetical protein
LTLTAFFLMSSAWALALPANGTYDEKDHIVRAYAVATGQLTARETLADWRGDVKPAFDVPASLLPTNLSVDCAWSPKPQTRPADCQRWLPGAQLISTPTGAGKYSPIYYLPVGIPLAISPDLTGLLLARMLSALLASLLVASAVTALLRIGRRLVALAIVLSCTPLVVDLFGSINPNGLEIAAGILVFSSLLALARAPGDRLDERSIRRLLVGATLGSLLLLTIRQLGPVWLLLDTSACVFLARPGRVRDLLRRRDARVLLGGSWLLGFAFAVGWLAYSGITQVAPVARNALHLSLPDAMYGILTQRVPFYLDQAVGSFDYGETHLSRPIIVVWYLLAAALVLPCLILAPRRAAVVVAGLGLASLAVLIVLELYFLPTVGWFSHVRYAMPSLVGVVLAGAVRGRWEERLIHRRRLYWYALVLAAAAGLIHVYALARVMSRFQDGLNAPVNPLHYMWRPPVGPLPPLLLMLAGAAVLTMLVIAAQPITAALAVADSEAPTSDCTTARFTTRAGWQPAERNSSSTSELPTGAT